MKSNKTMCFHQNDLTADNIIFVVYENQCENQLQTFEDVL